MGAVWELVVGHQLCVLLPLVAMLRQRAAKLLRVFYTLMDDGSINFLEDSDITIQLEVPPAPLFGEAVFLKANNSDDDQPKDRGANAHAATSGAASARSWHPAPLVPRRSARLGARSGSESQTAEARDLVYRTLIRLGLQVK
ncbi:hypothetical protein PPROV_000919900 [Pycnococcus provasolii]|uniref:Uncharacterized protein n=1 Tax=Pycnococcus provasolii TaxID=41880 RepID=A0A830HU15_9CHLO|nr:hypothetical protein PPROV_000919900 [Pycnococcus provasolii]